jgi:hypothetical protein
MPAGLTRLPSSLAGLQNATYLTPVFLEKAAKLQRPWGALAKLRSSARWAAGAERILIIILCFEGTIYAFHAIFMVGDPRGRVRATLLGEVLVGEAGAVHRLEVAAVDAVMVNFGELTVSLA